MKHKNKNWCTLESPTFYAVIGTIIILISKTILATSQTEEFTSKLKSFLPYVETVGWLFILIGGIVFFLYRWNSKTEK